MKVRSSVDGQRGVTIWLPIHRWPVVSVSVVDEDNRELLWSVIHASFSEAQFGHDDPIELTVTRASSASPEPYATVLNEIPLRYGHPPDGMKQIVPPRGAPPALQLGGRYMAVVRGNVANGVGWFEFTPDAR